MNMQRDRAVGLPRQRFQIKELLPLRARREIQRDIVFEDIVAARLQRNGPWHFAFRLAQLREVVEQGRDIRMIRPKRFFGNLQRALIKRD